MSAITRITTSNPAASDSHIVSLLKATGTSVSRLTVLEEPSYRIASTYGIAAQKARFCMWELYQWCQGNSYVTVLDTKSGSVWTSPSTLNNNDWFVAQWTSPSANKLKFDLWVQAADSTVLNVAPLNQRGLFVRVGYHASGTSWNGSCGNYGTPFFKSSSIVLPVADQMAQVAVLSAVGSIRCHTSGDHNCLMFAVDQEDSAEQYEGFWLGNYEQYQDPKPLALTCGDMRRLGTSGLSAGLDFTNESSGVVWIDDSVKPVHLLYLHGNAYTSYSQPIQRGPAPGSSSVLEMPIQIGAALGGGKRSLVGRLVGPAWAYGKTNETLLGPSGYRILMTDVDGGQYRCYGAISFPSDETVPGSPLAYSCKVGGPY